MRLRSALAASACSAALLQALNLAYVAHAQRCDLLTLECPDELRRWDSSDSAVYAGLARRASERGLLSLPTIRRTPGYPAVLLGARQLGGSMEAARWLAPALAGLAAASVAWLAAVLSGSTAAALAAGLLFSAWPACYAFSPILLTDAAHAFAAVAAVAASARWARSERGLAAIGASALWAAAQLLRPTFFAVPLLLPALLWRRRPTLRYAAISAALCASACAVPAWIVGANWARHGAAVPTALFANALRCYAVPRLIAETGGGSFSELRDDCLARFAGMPWEGRLRTQSEEGWRLLLDHPGQALRSHAREIAAQLLFPSRPYYLDSLAALYPPWLAVGPGGMVAWWLTALLGLGIAASRWPGAGVFLALLACSVLLPASFSHLVGARLRLPVELLTIPLVVVAAADLARRASRAPIRAADRRAGAPARR